MSRFALVVLWGWMASAQVSRTPACVQGAICFSGEVAGVQEFRKTINDALEFVLLPGWTIAIAPKQPANECQDFASIVSPPYRGHRDLYIDTTYNWTAEREVATSPRTFHFVTNCADYRTEAARLNIVLWPYTATKEKHDEALAKLGTSRLGSGRLWIMDSKIEASKIAWMKFRVEIVLPRQ